MIAFILFLSELFWRSFQSSLFVRFKKKDEKKGKCQISRYLVLFISIYLSPVAVILQTVHSADVFIDYSYHWYHAKTRGAKQPRSTRLDTSRCRIPNPACTQAYMTFWRPDCTWSFWRCYYPRVFLFAWYKVNGQLPKAKQTLF